VGLLFRKAPFVKMPEGQDQAGVNHRLSWFPPPSQRLKNARFMLHRWGQHSEKSPGTQRPFQPLVCLFFAGLPMPAIPQLLRFIA
jgi:hypothetical protein